MKKIMKTIFKLLCIPCIFCLMSFQYNWDSEDYEFTYVLDNFQDSYIICNVICSMEHTVKAEHIEIIIQDCVEEPCPSGRRSSRFSGPGANCGFGC